MFNKIESKQSSSTSEPTTTTKQKKPRQRNRPKNKRNREKVNETTVSTIATIEETTIESVNLLEDQENPAMSTTNKKTDPTSASSEKTREQIMAEREAKKLAKQAKKKGNQAENPQPKSTTDGESKTQVVTTSTPVTQIITEVEQTTITTKLTTTTTTRNPTATATATATTSSIVAVESSDKTRDQIKADREAKKAAKQAAKQSKNNTDVSGTTEQVSRLQVTETTAANPIDQEKKTPALTKAERRAVQEAQRAAKLQAKTATKPAVKTETKAAAKQQSQQQQQQKQLKTATESPAKVAVESPTNLLLAKSEREFKVKLFNHLVCAEKNISESINDPRLHYTMARLGEQYAKRTVVGSNARCIAFLSALRLVVQDFETPAKKEFGRSLDVAVKYHVEHLNKCRPLAVSVSNAYKQFKNQLMQLPSDKPETELKELLSHFIDTYIENQIGKAAQAISSSLQEKITDGDVLLTFGCSSLIHYICEEAKRRQVAFRVIVVDSRPFCEGQEMLRRLHAHGIPCTYVLINAISYIMPEATKVLLGAHALLANGYVMARTGTAQVALVAQAHNVPVLVCCETHKFSERFQTDAIVYNELCNPNQLVRDEKCCLNNWQSKCSKLTPLNISYDITPPELVSAVVTEVAILPCTSVPVILRIKPEIGY